MSCFFRHQHMSRVFTPRPAALAPFSNDAAQSYVVCLDCGAEFEYSLAAMQRGKKIFRGAERPDMVTLEREWRKEARRFRVQAGNATHSEPVVTIGTTEKVRRIR